MLGLRIFHFALFPMLGGAITEKMFLFAGTEKASEGCSWENVIQIYWH